MSLEGFAAERQRGRYHGTVRVDTSVENTEHARATVEWARPRRRGASNEAFDILDEKVSINVEDEFARARNMEKAIHMEEHVIPADDRSVMGTLVDENAQDRYPAGG